VYCSCLSSCRHCFSTLFIFLVVLYVGVFLLFTTGPMGIFVLCSFSCAFSFGGVGFFASDICFVFCGM
jgi:hypothetical protein